MTRVHWIVEGAVQGVGFRMWTARKARSLGIAGWVMNRPDGSVEVEAEGGTEAIAILETRIRKGPAHATVAACRRLPAGEDPLPERFEVRR